MVFTAQFNALAAVSADLLCLEPGIAHKSGNRILLDPECRNTPGVDHVVSRGNDTNLLVDRNHHRIVDFDQVVVVLDLGRINDLFVWRRQVGQEGNTGTVAVQVVVTPFPLHAGDLDRDVGIGSILHRHHRLGGRQGHADNDEERHHGPGDFNAGTFVEAGRFVAERFAMFENGVEHHPENSEEDHYANDQHQVMQIIDLLSDLCHRRLKVHLQYRWTTRAIDHRPRRHSCRKEQRTEHQRYKALRIFHDFLKSPKL